LSAALLSEIIDVAETLRDLCATFPKSREIEAEAVSLGLPMDRLPEIREHIDTVVLKINHFDGATEGARNAINASAAVLNSNAPLPTRPSKAPTSSSISPTSRALA
jgi:hypothetical protein